MTRQRSPLDGRAADVFDQFMNRDAGGLHPEDREEAERFWQWLGEFEAPQAEIAARPFRSRSWIAAAVAACLVVFAASLWFVVGSPEPAAAQYQTAHAELREIRLEDGSTVRLGAESAIEVAYTDRERRIRLTRGEALFDVEHGRSRPFIVETATGEVRAIGTSFNVRLADGGARVTVIEGVVQVRPKGGGGASIVRTARAGEQLRFGEDSKGGHEATVDFLTAPRPADVSRATGWTRGMLYFHGEPLAEAIAVVNRYADRPIELSDPALADMPVFATLRAGDTSAIEELMRDPDGLGAK